MCGIAGILRITPASVGPEALRLAMVRPHAEAIPEAWLDVLDASIKHRGPDGQGRFRDRAVRPDGTVVDVAFVHRRLSIIDLAGGAQPMVAVGSSDAAPSPAPSGGGGRVFEVGGGERAGVPPALLFHGRPNDPVEYRPIAGDDGSPDLCAVVFNGCIYNHRELRKELEAQGQRFVTDHSDTEVLLQGWRMWGDGLSDRLNGMFSIAIWNASDASLQLFRDPFGEKPLNLLHHHCDGSWFNMFSSGPLQTPSLGQPLGVSDIPIPAIATPESWLRMGYCSCNPLDGARCVEPGSSLRYRHTDHPSRQINASQENDQGEARAPSTSAFGPLTRDFQPGLPYRNEPLGIDQLEDLLSAAVVRRLEADVLIGCFLSGGVDSSLVAYYAKRELSDLRTFTVRMPTPEYDESAHAEAVAAHLGTRHQTLDCDAEPAEDLVKLIEQLGMPFGDSSLLPAYWLSRAARRHVKVALSGDGGDELFVGYERYQATNWLRNRIPGAQVLASLLSYQARPKSTRAKIGRYFDALGHAGYFDLISIFPTSTLRQVCRDSRAHAHDSAQWRKWRSDWSLEMAISFDLFNYLPDDLMRKTDTAAMSVGLEVRAPFLDPSLVRACLSAPISSLMPRGERKGLLRQVARRYLPAAIVDRPKQGFAIPIGDWFRTDFGGMKTLLMDHLGSVEPFGPPRLGIDLNMGFIRRLVDEHMDGRRDHGQRLYMLLVLSIWARWLGRVG